MSNATRCDAAAGNRDDGHCTPSELPESLLDLDLDHPDRLLCGESHGELVCG